MFRQFKLAMAIAVALSTVGIMGSAEAHIGGRGGGIRIGGGLIPRARGNGNGNRNNVPAPVPAPKAAAAPVAPKANTTPIVPIAGTKTTSQPPATNATTNSNKPITGNVTSANTPVKNSAPQSTSDKVQSASAQTQTQTPVPTNAPVKSNAHNAGHLVFSLTGAAASEAEAEANATEASAVQPKGLPEETKKALAALTADAAAESAPAELVAKEVPLPQIPVGATVTLQGQNLSDKEGQVVLQIGEIALPATITSWKNNAVTCTLPVLGLTKASKATLHVLNADGKTASQLNCELVTAATP